MVRIRRENRVGLGLPGSQMETNLEGKTLGQGSINLLSSMRETPAANNWFESRPNMKHARILGRVLCVVSKSTLQDLRTRLAGCPSFAPGLSLVKWRRIQTATGGGCSWCGERCRGRGRPDGRLLADGLSDNFPPSVSLWTLNKQQVWTFGKQQVHFSLPAHAGREFLEKNGKLCSWLIWRAHTPKEEADAALNTQLFDPWLILTGSPASEGSRITFRGVAL